MAGSRLAGHRGWPPAELPGGTVRPALHHEAERNRNGARHLPFHRRGARRAAVGRTGRAQSRCHDRTAHGPAGAPDDTAESHAEAERCMIPAAGTVFVVDDNAAVRASLRTLFGAAGLHVETYASSADFLAGYDARRPGCLVLDLKLRGESGLDLLEQLPPRPATLPVIVLTAYGRVPASVRAMNAGAIDFVEKSMRPVQLLGCVRTALELAGRQHEVEAAQQAIVQRAARLTPREQQIAELLVAGKRSKEIAASLGVSPRTVDSYRSRLLDKMHVESTTELIAALLRLRRVPPR